MKKIGLCERQSRDSREPGNSCVQSYDYWLLARWNSNQVVKTQTEQTFVPRKIYVPQETKRKSFTLLNDEH
jgi:hypothetical protein